MITMETMRSRVVPQAIEFIKTEWAKLMAEAEWKKLFLEKKDSHQFVEVRGEESMDMLQRVNFAAPIPELALGDGWPKRITQYSYKGKLVWPKEVGKFDRFDIIASHRRHLAKAGPLLMEVLIAAFWEYCDTAVASVPTLAGTPMVDTAAPDGNPVAYNAHTFKSNPAITYSNKGVDSDGAFGALNQSNLAAVANKVMNWTASNGAMLNCRVKRVIVPTGLRHRIAELLKSTLEPDTGNNKVNSAREDFGAGDYMVYHWQTNQTEWSVETDVENGYRVRRGWDVETDQGENKEIQTLFITADTSFSIGCQDVRRFCFVKAA